MLHDFVRLRQLERAVVRAAQDCGIDRPTIYDDHERPATNCLDPLGRAIYWRLPRETVAGDLRIVARRMCESIARAAQGAHA